MKTLRNLFIASALCLPLAGMAQTEEPIEPEWDIYPDTWVGVDGVGRVTPNNDETGDYKFGKQHTVGIFYVTWHTDGYYGEHHPYGADVSKVLEQDPEARKDGSNAAWQSQYYGTYHWGEPEAGYFLSADPYVIRHDISMLADAGVDVLILDITNGVTYWKEWWALFDELEDMKSAGNKVPKICFWSYNGESIYKVQEVYDLLYSQGKYKDLWFYWYGKPLFLYNANPSEDANGTGKKLKNYLYDATAATDKTNPHYGDPLYTSEYLTDYPSYLTDFFTFRNMWWGYDYWYGKKYVGTEDNWSFGLDMQNLTSRSAQSLTALHNGRYEEYAVTPAQHPASLVGKCWTKTDGEPELDEYDLPVSMYVDDAGKEVDDPEAYGIYFQDRWDEALSVSPDFIYLNDWNEYIAGKYGGTYNFMRRSSNNFFFVDQYNAEFNRTIGPVKGRYTDNYYMQMTSNIRKYKGTRPIPHNYGIADSGVVNGDTAAWSNITTEYRDTKGDVTHRGYNGYAGNYYTDVLGRNDIQRTKVAVTGDSIFFRIETGSALTSWSDDNWMLLFIDADNDHSTGWNGYDFVVNKNIASETSSEVTKCVTDTASWSKAGDARIAISDNVLLVGMSRSMLGLTSDDITFDFKVVDNPSNFSSPISLATAGDAAPNRRFNYRFIWSKNGSSTVSYRDKLIDFVQDCRKKDYLVSYAYGTDPGMVADSSVCVNYDNTLKYAFSVATDSTTEEAWKAAYDSLTNALNTLVNADIVPVTPGYYYIMSCNSAYDEGTNAMWPGSASYNTLRWQKFDNSNVEFVWKLDSISGGYSLQNMSTYKYINKSLRNAAGGIMRQSDTIGSPQLFAALNHAGQVNIYNTENELVYYQKGGDTGSTTLGTVALGSGGVNSGAAWKLVSAEAFFDEFRKKPLDSLIALSVTKINESEVVVDGSVDPQSPANNSGIKPALENLAQLVGQDSVLDKHAITQATIDSLAAAYDSLLAVWPDSDRLILLCNEALDIAKKSDSGNLIGATTKEMADKLLEAYNSTMGMRPFYAYVKSTLDSLADNMAALIEEAKANISMPEAGVWYNIISADTTASAYERGGSCLYPVSRQSNAIIVCDGDEASHPKETAIGWRFVALTDSTYAIQNVGSGWYVGTTTNLGDRLRMSPDPVPFKIISNGMAQWTIVQADSNTIFTAMDRRHYTTLYSGVAVNDSLCSWSIKRVGRENFCDSLSVVQGTLNVLTMPYAQAELPKATNGSTIKFYVICGSKLNESGNTIEIDLAEYNESTVPAGLPLVYTTDGEYSASTNVPFIVTPEFDSEITNESTNNNGLVSVFTNVQIQNDSCGRFSLSTVVPMSVSTTVYAGTGYVNASKIADLTDMETALAVQVGSDGLLNYIEGVTVDASALVDVYSTDGVLLRKDVAFGRALDGLQRGIYIIGKKKYRK